MHQVKNISYDLIKLRRRIIIQNVLFSFKTNTHIIYFVGYNQCDLIFCQKNLYIKLKF